MKEVLICGENVMMTMSDLKNVNETGCENGPRLATAKPLGGV